MVFAPTTTTIFRVDFDSNIVAVTLFFGRKDFAAKNINLIRKNRFFVEYDSTTERSKEKL
jgi:hypothetical protein